MKSKPEENKKKIILVDDHPIVRQGLADLINHEKDFVVCGQAEDAGRLDEPKVVGVVEDDRHNQKKDQNNHRPERPPTNACPIAESAPEAPFSLKLDLLQIHQAVLCHWVSPQSPVGLKPRTIMRRMKMIISLLSPPKK